MFSMKVHERLELFKKWPTEEILTEEDLKKLLENGEKLKHYIGFEISGRIHLGTGIGCMQKLVDLQKADVECSVFLADYHAWINNKLGGNWENIQKAVEYYKESFKACIKALGGNPDKVNYIVGSELYHNNDEYWKTVIDVSKNISIGRIMRSITIIGRQEKDLTSFAQLLYPPMQVSDIFIQGINITHAGLDQRKAHVVAREVAPKLVIKPLKNHMKPVAVHHHLWLGLQKPPIWPIPKNEDKQELWTSMKMSKSKPKTAIFLNDSPEEIKDKIKGAFCPEKEVEFNPIMDWARNIIFYNNKPLKIKRTPKFGGDLTVKNYAELEKIYKLGKLHPMDLKNAMAEFLIEFLKPVREHFKDKQHLIKMMKSFQTTR